MSPFIEYLVKLSLGLTVTSLFYHFVLSRFTFYHWNRWYLLGYSALAFVIPFINVDRVLESTHLVNNGVVRAVPSISHFAYSETVSMPVPTQHTNLSLVEILSVIFILGVVTLVVRLGIQVVSYFKMKKDSELISDDDVKIYHSGKDIIPFSFGNAIFINPTLHSESDLKKIVLHEFIHVKQNHTSDILFGELLSILNWYNPFAWLIRHAIRQNLEYIADRAVLDNGIDIKQYQYLLLKVVGIPEFRIANQFNFSSLKQRIIMMNKMKTARIHLIRFLFVLPLMCVLLMAFRNDIETFVDGKQKGPGSFEKKGGSTQNKIFYLAGFAIDGETGEPIENLPLKFDLNEKLVKKLRSDKDGFYYYELDVSKYSDSVMYYGLTSEGKYSGYAMGSSFDIKTVNDGDFYISFLNENGVVIRNGKAEKIYGQFPYFVDKKEFFAANRPTNMKATIKNYLTEKKRKFTIEHNLIVAFKKAYPEPKDIITKFGNGFFNQRQDLVGYESQTEFYLDGNKATYQDVNKAFENKSIMEDRSIRADPNSYASINRAMFFFTYPTHKKAPPVYLLKNNFEMIDVNKFDTTAFDNEAYFLDGFRQTYGIGSNIKPLKSEIKRVILFKGNLAKYYDQKLDRIWWIETRPETEVFERPDLAN